MSDEGSIKYWEAVLETIKLIRGLNQYQNEHPEASKSLTDHLTEIMQKAAAKSGGTSSLTQELGLSFITHKPSTYWKAVEDTVGTVRSFILWKEENPADPRDLETFLVEFWTKAEQKVQKASPLAKELGLDFLVEESPVSSPPSIREAPPTTLTPGPAPPLASPEPTPAPAPIETPISVPRPEPTPAPAPIETPISIPRPEPKAELVIEPRATPPAETGPALPSSLPPRDASPPIEAPEPELIPVAEPVTAPSPEEPKIQLSEDLLSQLREEEPPAPEEPSLKDELLDVSEEEDLLSSSLRAALKMLRDDEED